VSVIDVLEQDLRRPVLTANQVLLWRCLGVADVHLRPHGFGRLFDSDVAQRP
jgi:maleate isomerase